MIVNLRESLNTRDRKSVNGNSKYYDLVNLYESCNLSADNKKTLAKMINNNASDKAIYSFLYECYEGKEDIKEDTVKKDGKWVNKGKEGTHGEFKTKKAADAQRKAMFANGYKGESLKETLPMLDKRSIEEIDGVRYAYDYLTQKDLAEVKDIVLKLLRKEFPNSTFEVYSITLTYDELSMGVLKDDEDFNRGISIKLNRFDYSDNLNKVLNKYTPQLAHELIDEMESESLKESLNFNEAEEILYVIKDSHGNQLSKPNADDSELWDRVASMEARGRRGLRVVVYTGKKESLAEDKGQPRSNRYTTYFNRIKRAIEKGDEETLKRTKEAIMYAPAKELKNSEARELMNMIKNRKITESVSGKYGEVKYEPRRDGMSGESAVYANYHLFSNDGKYTPYWAGERPMGSSYNSVEDAVKGIDAFIDRQRKDGKMLYMKPVKESLESEDGWSEEILDIVDPFFVEVETVAYELRNTVRGAYRFGTTVEDLVQVFRGFSKTADDIANELDDNQEHLEEDWCSIKEESHEECIGNNCTDENDLFPEEKYFTIVVTRSDDGEDEIIDDVTKEIADKYIDDLKRDNDEFFSHAKVLDHNGEVVNSWEYLEEAAKSKKSSSIKDRLKKLIPDLDI